MERPIVCRGGTRRSRRCGLPCCSNGTEGHSGWVGLLVVLQLRLIHLRQCLVQPHQHRNPLFRRHVFEELRVRVGGVYLDSSTSQVEDDLRCPVRNVAAAPCP